jgi:transketolase
MSEQSSQGNLDQLCVNTIRLLAVDMVEAAKSGHPGLPLGAAPIAYVIWTRFLRHNPANPKWINRDRFILSAGHGSALLYAMLHVTGYDLSLEELKNFRQWGSKTPGHPEYGLTPGVECTTGPLGQGFANGVGMAMAERYLASQFNREGFPVIANRVYAICSDGDLMEGVASEAASIAGHLKLGNLVYVYDDNHITIEGDTDLAFSENVGQRFESYGWHVTYVEDGNDLDALEKGIAEGRDETERPSLVIVRTQIGFGSPKQGQAASHGEPLGPEATRATKEFFGFSPDESFAIPEEALARMRECAESGAKLEAEWKALLAKYAKAYPEEAAQLDRQIHRELPPDWDADIPVFKPEDGPAATRNASGAVMNALAPRLPNLVGGSADLAPSTKTLLKEGGDMGPGTSGRNLHFGIREHAMGAIVNGMALYGGLIPYGATFLIFSDYMRPTMRLAAMSHLHSVFVFTHDSIGLGEDGPTHQPVEQLASLRAIPHLTVIRPADANETAEAWRVTCERCTPVALVLTRQKLPVLDTSKYPVREGVRRGAYVLSESDGTPEVILIASGSEVEVALAAQRKLAGDGVKARVVSMPSWDLFEQQSTAYRQSVLPPEVTARISIEAAEPLGWERYLGDRGVAIGVKCYGASAPYKINMQEYGFSVANIVERVEEMLGRK